MHNKTIILLAAFWVFTFVTNAQSEKWKAYSDIVKQFHSDMTPCEKLELYARMDSVYEKNYSYAETLNQMQEEDQAVRRAFHYRTLTPDEEHSLSRRMHEVDSANVVKLKWLIDTLGFPTWERVCSYGSYDAWVIAQHAPMQYQLALPDRNATGRYRCC